MKEHKPQSYVPHVVERTEHGIDTYDLYSRLLEDRIIIFGEEVNNRTAMDTVNMLLYLNAKDGSKPIEMYINSPGGSIIDGLAIIDIMHHIKAPVHTTALGMAASMGAVLLACGAPGHRKALPNSEIMIHQPSGGMQGQSTDMEIAVKHILKMKVRLYGILALATGKTVKEITEASERDNWLSAQDAMEYGLIDNIIKIDPIKYTKVKA